MDDALTEFVAVAVVIIAVVVGIAAVAFGPAVAWMLGG
jgi:hypothetical protein